jgi:hypothetical protein
MLGSEFVRLYANRGPAAWEAAALEMAKNKQHVAWPLVPVTFTDGRHTLIVHVASDYFAVGDPNANDVLRLPLTPLTAQKIADVFGMLLPTPKMVKAIHEQASTHLTVQPVQPNKYANLAQYAEHNDRIERELDAQPDPDAARQGLISGHKKDVVLGNQARANRVLIYGLMKPVVPPGVDAQPMMTAPWRVQPYSSVHGTDYVDDSHGIRFVAPEAELDGAPVSLEKVMTDPALAALVSDEGPLRKTRYDVPRGNSTPIPYIPDAPRIVDQGLAWVQEQVLERKD